MSPNHLQDRGLLSGKAESSSEGHRYEVLATNPAADNLWVHWPSKRDPGRSPTTSATESIPEAHENNTQIEKERGVILDYEFCHFSPP